MSEVAQRRTYASVRSSIGDIRQYSDGNATVCFSGGKDSLVVLDLALRAGVENAVFCNTGIEYEQTLDYIKTIEDFYGITIRQLKPTKSFFELFDHLAFPSRRMRWCCEVLKFAPLVKFAKDKKVSAFITGLRKEEHHRRRKYSSVSSWKMIPSIQINPIINWRNDDVWKYIRKYSIPINPLYDIGRKRVGCWPCPFNSQNDWNILKEVFPEKFDFLKERILESIEKFGSYGICNIDDFIGKFAWTKYAYPQISNIEGYISQENNIHLSFKKNEHENKFDKVASILGKYNRDNGGFTVESDNMRKCVVLAEKAINCVGCGACLPSCPTGALSINDGSIEVDKENCIHCLACCENAIRSNCIMRNYSPVKNIVRIRNKEQDLSDISKQEILFSSKRNGNISSFRTKLSISNIKDKISNFASFANFNGKIIIKGEEFYGIIYKDGRFTNVTLYGYKSENDVRKIRELLSNENLDKYYGEKEFKTESRPCTTEIDGKTVKTCDLFGHFYKNNVCIRCEHEEMAPTPS